MAVQVISYEVRMAWLATQESEKTAEYEEAEYPLVDDLERFYGHLEQTLLSTGFIREGHPGQVMNKLRRLFTRARPESQELNILRGILASIEQQNKGK
jgi:tRNA (cytidine32/uridine32-2'-O)-methyltransferase